jgi:hypothetical protein
VWASIRLNSPDIRCDPATSPAPVEANAPVMKIVETTRHRSIDMLRVYSRRVDLFREHSGAAFL